MPIAEDHIVLFPPLAVFLSPPEPSTVQTPQQGAVKCNLIAGDIQQFDLAIVQAEGEVLGCGRDGYVVGGAVRRGTEGTEEFAQ